MKIVIDTNIFCADYRMAGGGFRVFLEGLLRLGATCCVPEIVWDELLHKHLQQLQDAATKIVQANRTWAQLTGRPLVTQADQANAASANQEYRQFLEQRFREEGITLLPYPEISHRTLATRAVMRKKPFSESGSGYRDSLIWASVLAILGTKEDAVFITNNSKDFGECPNLHPDLAADLQTGMKIEIYNKLEQFNAARIVPQLEQLESVRQQLQENRFAGFSLAGWIDRDLRDILNDYELAWDFAGVEQGHGSTWFSALRPPRNTVVDDVRRLPSGDLLVSAHIDVTLEVTVSADREDWMRFEDIRRIVDQEVLGFSDTFWDIDTTIAFSLTINHRTFIVESCDIDQIGHPCHFEINPHPSQNG